MVYLLTTMSDIAVLYCTLTCPKIVQKFISSVHYIIRNVSGPLEFVRGQTCTLNMYACINVTPLHVPMVRGHMRNVERGPLSRPTVAA